MKAYAVTRSRNADEGTLVYVNGGGNALTFLPCLMEILEYVVPDTSQVRLLTNAGDDSNADRDIYWFLPMDHPSTSPFFGSLQVVSEGPATLVWPTFYAYARML